MLNLQPWRTIPSVNAIREQHALSGWHKTSRGAEDVASIFSHLFSGGAEISVFPELGNVNTSKCITEDEETRFTSKEEKPSAMLVFTAPTSANRCASFHANRNTVHPTRFPWR